MSSIQRVCQDLSGYHHIIMGKNEYTIEAPHLDSEKRSIVIDVKIESSTLRITLIPPKLIADNAAWGGEYKIQEGPKEKEKGFLTFSPPKDPNTDKFTLYATRTLSPLEPPSQSGIAWTVQR